jgi:putative lipoic acid-binding regulatory protein
VSEVKKEEYIEISLTQILVVVFKNVKTFVVMVVLGGLLTLALAFALTWQPNYNYKQMIQPPFYLSGQSEAALLGGDKLNVILQNTLIGMQQSGMNNNLLNSIQVLAPTNTEDSSSKDLKRMYFSLSVNTVFENKDQIQSLYNTLMNDFSNSSIIKKQVELWKQNIHRSLNANEENITRYNSLIKQNQDYLKELSSQKRLSGIDGQTLLSSYISRIDSRIDSYQKKIFSLEDLQRDLKLKFESLQPNLSEFGSMIYQKNSKLSKAKILVIGFVLSIFMAFIAVFMKIVIRKAMIEYKDSKDSN